MIYSYSQKNRMEEPVNYMYTDFHGVQFLDSYLSSRVEVANRFQAVNGENTAFDQVLVVKAVPTLEHFFGTAAPNMKEKFLSFIDHGEMKLGTLTNQETSRLNSHARNLGNFTISEKVKTLDLLHQLISVQLTDSTNPKIRVWLDRLVQRFEVSKKLYELYLVSFRGGDGKSTSVRLYWLFALALCLFYAHTQKLKYLNTLLKVCDLLCSLPQDILEENIPSRGLPIVIATEVVSIQLLAEKTGVFFAPK